MITRRCDYFMSDSAPRLAKKLQTPNDNQLRLITAQSHVHAALVSQKAERAETSTRIISYQRYNDEIGLVALKGIHGTNEGAPFRTGANESRWASSVGSSDSTRLCSLSPWAL